MKPTMRRSSMRHSIIWEYGSSPLILPFCHGAGRQLSYVLYISVCLSCWSPSWSLDVRSWEGKHDSYLWFHTLQCTSVWRANHVCVPHLPQRSKVQARVIPHVTTSVSCHLLSCVSISAYLDEPDRNRSVICVYMTGMGTAEGTWF